MRDWTFSSLFRRSIVSFICDVAVRWLPLLLAVTILATPFATAQTQTPAQTPFLFANTPVNSAQTSVVTLLRNPASGVLTLLSAQAAAFPHADCIPQVMDPQGTFLYGDCGNGIAMYSFDSTSGAIQEIANSPYAASTVDAPLLIAAEGTGQYLYLLKFSNPSPTSAVTYVLDTFQIDRTVSPSLVPISSQTLPFDGMVAQTETAAADPNGHGIAIFGIQTDPVTAATTPVAFIVSFDPTTGLATIPTAGATLPGTSPVSFRLSLQGQYLALGSTTTTFGAAPISYTTLLSLSQSTFQIVGSAVTLTSPSDGIETSEPLFLQFDPLGKLLYVQYANSGVPAGAPSPFEIYETPTLSDIGTLPFSQGEIAFNGVPDPDGPCIYEAVPGTPPQGLSVYVIDPGTGIPVQPAALANPFFPTMNLFPLFANYASAGSTQNLSGPFLSQSASSLSFGPTTTGHSSALQTVMLKSVGGQSVTLNSVTLTGANAGDFAISGTCLTTPQLTPQTSCALSIMYQPTGVGTGLASVTITGDSPTSPQSIALSGTSVAAPPPAPVVTITPASPFTLSGTITQGASSTPQNITVANGGNAVLHVTNVVLGGLNATDYSIGASNCATAVAVNSNCIIPVIFSPVASGIRSATVTITDDAANSPQVWDINGTASDVASINPSIGGTTIATVSAGQTAHFNLTATPGSGFNGTIAFACSGAPFAAACTVAPSPVTVANGAATPFVVSVTTSGATAFAPFVYNPPLTHNLRSSVFLLWAVVLLLALMAAIGNSKLLRSLPLAVSTSLFVALVFSGMGCNSGGGTPQASASQATLTTATPAITPNGGTFTTSYPMVTITDGTAGAAIYYTTDGSAATSASAVYSAPFSLNSAATVQAIAIASGYATSLAASAAFQLQTASGTYTLTITPTAIATGSSKPLQINPIQLTLTVK